MVAHNRILNVIKIILVVTAAVSGLYQKKHVHNYTQL